MSDGNPAFMAYVCTECPCLGGGDDGYVFCNLKYDQFLTESSEWASEIQECKLRKVEFVGGSFEPVPVLVQRRVYKPYKSMPMDVLMRKYYEPAMVKAVEEGSGLLKRIKEAAKR